MLSRYGHEIRTTTLRTRLKLELQTEIGKQQVLQLQGSAHFNDRVLQACEQRLARIMDPRVANTKLQRSWDRRAYYPEIGAMARKASKMSHTDPKTEQLLCKLTWPAWWKTQPHGNPISQPAASCPKQPQGPTLHWPTRGPSHPGSDPVGGLYFPSLQGRCRLRPALHCQGLEAAEKRWVSR